MSNSLLTASITKQLDVPHNEIRGIGIVDLRIEQGNHILFAIDQSNVTQYWDINLMKRLEEIDDSNMHFINNKLSFDGILAAIIQDGSLHITNTSSNVTVARFTADNPILCYCFSSNQAQIMAGDALGAIHFLELKGRYL